MHKSVGNTTLRSGQYTVYDNLLFRVIYINCGYVAIAIAYKAFSAISITSVSLV